MDTNNSQIKTYKKLLFLLSPDEIRKGSYLLLIMLIMGLLEMVGVASIMPFIAVLSNPDIIDTNNNFKSIFLFANEYGIETRKQFLYLLGVTVFITLITSILFKSFSVYAQLRYAQMREYTIGRRLMKGYLSQPYNWFLNRHSADLGKTILSEVQLVIAYGLISILNIMSQCIIVLALIILLIFIDIKITFITGFIIVFTYLLIFILSSKYNQRIGKERLEANESRFTILTEAFGAIKEIKIGGLEKSFVNRFEKPAITYARHQTSSQVLQTLPRYIVETLIFGGIVLVTLYFLKQESDLKSYVPLLATYAFAGYRLLPAFQQAYVSFTKVKFIGPTINSLYDDLKSLEILNSNFNQDKIVFENLIKLNSINYRYNKKSQLVLQDISINIPSYSTVGFVGLSGSGKTTIIDILLGLIEAEKGQLKVDDVIINKSNVKSWQKLIGYVPQQIFLSDDTIASNIGFGIDPEKIDQKSIEKAAKIANLHEFIMKELPDQYQTKVGERGVRLSGGQRQRIGIARALYHNPKLLIFDEATSALDNLTEQVVMEAVYKLNKKVTIILIAHRLNTIKACDNIFLIQNGKLKNQGTYEELLKFDKHFKEISNTTH